MTRVLPWLLLLAAAVLYGWRLGEMPTYVSPDEAIIAVDAHAIATTGRDVHGVAMPLYFFIQMPKSERSGWFTPVIFYLSAAVQLVLPFNEWSVRLPSVLVGLSNLALMFILVRGMFGSWPLALSASALLALSPAHYIFSRYALDYLYPVPFLIAWLVALRRALDAPTAGRLAAVGLFLGLGFYSYAAAVVLTPMLFLLSLLLLAGVVGDWKRLAPVAAGYLVPLILFAVWFAAHPDAFANTAQRYALYDSSRLNLLQGVREFLSGPNIERMVSIYWSFLSPSVLFLSGDQLITFSTRQAGVFPTALSLLMVLGLIQIIERERTRMAVAIVVAFLMAPIPAVLVPESGAVNRATAILPFGVLIATYGLKLLSSVRVITHARAIAIVVGSVALLLGVAYASWTLLSEGRLGGSAAGIVLLGAILATFAALSRGRAQGPLVAAAVLALIVVQFGRFAYDYHGDYRLRVNSWLGGNLRGALEALIDHLPPGSSSPVYFAHFQSSGGVADIRNYFMDAYWRFYLIKHRREDLLGRAVALEPGPITGVAPGSFVLGNLGDRQVDALIATGELKPVATFPELDRDPFFVLLEKRGS